MKNEIIKKITINIGGTEVEVTPQQAKDLHEALGNLLNVQPAVQLVEKHIHHEKQWSPYWPYNWPTISSGTGNLPALDKWTITYAAQSQSALLAIQ